MKDYKLYINKINECLSELENAFIEYDNITKFQPYLKKLEKSKLELNKYIKSLKKQDYKKDFNYILYNVYPSIIVKDYNKQILEHIILQQFYNEDGSMVMNTKSKYKMFKLNPVQKLLRNLLGPNTPYNNMLLVHDPGVGKTCTAITIAENLKKRIRLNNKRIYIVRPDEFKKQLFDIEKVKKNEVSNQCTGSSYLDEVRKINAVNEDYLMKCIKGDNDACERLKKI